MPGLAYIYIPSSSFARFETDLGSLYPDAKCNGKRCMFEKPCRQVSRSSIDFALNLKDATGKTISLELLSGEMLVDGQEVTGGNASQCFLPVFSHAATE